MVLKCCKSSPTSAPCVLEFSDPTHVHVSCMLALALLVALLVAPTARSFLVHRVAVSLSVSLALSAFISLRKYVMIWFISAVDLIALLVHTLAHRPGDLPFARRIHDWLRFD